MFNQKLTTQAVLQELDQRGVLFMALRMRSPALIAHIEKIDQRAWKAVRPRKHEGSKQVNVDLDVALAGTVFAALRRRLPGYQTATPDTLPRRFLRTDGVIKNDDTVTVRLDRRAYWPCRAEPTSPTPACPGGAVAAYTSSTRKSRAGLTARQSALTAALIVGDGRGTSGPAHKSRSAVRRSTHDFHGARE